MLALGAQPVGALEQRVVVEHRDEAKADPPISPRHSAIAFHLSRRVLVASERDPRARPDRIRRGGWHDEYREQRAALFIEEVGRLPLARLGETRADEADPRRRVIGNQDAEAGPLAEPLLDLGRVRRRARPP